MSFDMTTFGVTWIYVLILQPFALLQILPFRRFLTAAQKKRLVICWCLLIVLEAHLVTVIVSMAIFPSHQIAYWLLGYLIWVPQFLLAFSFTRRFWAGHIFIAAFRILFSSIIYTFTRAILLMAFPDKLLPSLYFEQILLYGILSLLIFPILLRFFTDTFRHFEMASTRRYWRIITLLPVLLAIESLYLSLLNSQEQVFALLLPRFMLLIVIFLLMASIRSGQSEVYRELQVFEKEHELQRQLVSTARYVKMSEESRHRMASIYEKRRNHIDHLLALVSQRDREGALACIEALGAQFSRTKLPQYCKNTLINAALTVYFARAKELAIPVTAAIDLPEKLSFSGDLSIVLSNLVENALLASQKQPPAARHIAVMTMCQGDVINVLVKNRFDAPVEFDEEGLPVTHVKGHGIGMKSLSRFCDKYKASVFCQQKDGWFMTYLQVPLLAEASDRSR